MAPIILGVAAAFFTFGGSLALGGLTLGGAGGWGGAVASLMSKIGLGAQSTLGSILGSALKFAGTGAASGGALAAITGGDISEGAAQGALQGAVLGGGLGLAGRVAGAAGAATGVAAPVTPVDVSPLASLGEPITPVGVSALAPPPTPGFFSKVMGAGGWIERNQGLVGPVLSNVGGALLQGISEKDQREHQTERDAQRGHDIPRLWQQPAVAR